MYLAMNRFTVPHQNADAFEALWLGRESHLNDMEGFVEFHMLRGPEGEDGSILFASHTIWESEEHFLAWTRSESFRQAHKNAGKEKLYTGHPKFEGFSAIQTIKSS